MNGKESPWEIEIKWREVLTLGNFSFFLLMSGESIGVIRLTTGRNLLERLLLAFSIHEPFIFLALPKGFPVTFSFFFPVALGK